MTVILGFNAFHADSAACLVYNMMQCESYLR